MIALLSPVWLGSPPLCCVLRPPQHCQAACECVQTSSRAEDPGTGGQGLLHVKYRMHVLQADIFVTTLLSVSGRQCFGGWHEEWVQLVLVEWELV